MFISLRSSSEMHSWKNGARKYKNKILIEISFQTSYASGVKPKSKTPKTVPNANVCFSPAITKDKHVVQKRKNGTSNN